MTNATWPKVKINESHDRLSMTCKYEDGSNFRFGINRNSESLSCSNSLNVDRENMKTFMTFAKTALDDHERNGERLKRVAEVVSRFETFGKLLTHLRGF